MKNYLKKFTLVYLVSAFALGGAAWARQPEVTRADIVVAKGQTRDGNVATDRSILVDGTLNGDATAIGGGTVTINGELTGDLVSMGGPVSISGRVRGDVSSIGGPVEVSGRVHGNVSAVGGKVTLSGEGMVDGEISALGGAVEKGPGTVHKGSVNSFSAGALKGTLAKALSTARGAARAHPGPGDSRNWRTETRTWSTDFSRIQADDFKTLALLMAAWFAVFLVVLAAGVLLVALPAIFFPENVRKVNGALGGDLWKACAIGALILVGLFPGLLLLTVSILGIPLVPFALILFAAAAVLGLSAFSVIVQERFFDGIKKPGPEGLPGKAAAGAALMGALLFFGKMIPLVGGLLVLVGLMLLAFGIMTGLGAAWVTRMGTRPFTPAALPAAPVPPVTPAG